MVVMQIDTGCFDHVHILKIPRESVAVQKMQFSDFCFNKMLTLGSIHTDR